MSTIFDFTKNMMINGKAINGRPLITQAQIASCPTAHKIYAKVLDIPWEDIDADKNIGCNNILPITCLLRPGCTKKGEVVIGNNEKIKVIIPHPYNEEYIIVTFVKSENIIHIGTNEEIADRIRSQILSEINIVDKLTL